MNDDAQSPGKGLESLIPKKTPASSGAADASSSPVPPPAESAPGGLGYSPLDPSRELAAEPEPVFLHIASGDDFLPEEHDDMLPSPPPLHPKATEPAIPPANLPVGPEEADLLFSESGAPEEKTSLSGAAPRRFTTPRLPPGSIPHHKPRPAAPAVHHRHPAHSAESEPDTAKPYEAVFHIEVDKVRPNPQQPRRNFDEGAIRELAASIREFGILQPLVVTKTEKEVPTGTEVEYYLVAGERRLMAAKVAGLERVPAVIRTVGADRERLELAIIENLQREDLNPVETARAFARLQDEFRMTQREIATRMGKSREAIANTMRLLDLPPYIRDAVEAGRISESHGRLLLSIDDPIAQERLFNDLVNQRMTTRELKNRVDAARRTKSESSPSSGNDPEFRVIQEKLSSELGAPVKISGGEEGGKITINFYSKEELENILRKIAAGEEF